MGNENMTEHIAFITDDEFVQISAEAIAEFIGKFTEKTGETKGTATIMMLGATLMGMVAKKIFKKDEHDD